MRINILARFLVMASISASALASDPDAIYLQTPVDLNYIPVCYNFGCEERPIVSISEHEWSETAGWFTPVSSAAKERQQIRQAVGWMEVIIGRYTPTHRDIGRNLADEGQQERWPGQLDCIDESINTTIYLRLFEQRGLLKWHRVVERENRRAIWDQHWTAQVEELRTGARYAVDSWFDDNGTLPYVQKIEEWRKLKSAVTSFFNTAPVPLNP